MAALTASSVLAMVLTYIAITHCFTPASQQIAASVSLAFEGFIFGGAFQFLFEGRRLLRTERDERIAKYHEKLKHQVLNFWCTRTVEQSQVFASNPQCRDNLYVAIDLSSNIDPDKRYLNDTLKHLQNKKYVKVAQTRDQISQDVLKHNKEVASFAASIDEFVSKCLHLGFEPVTISAADTPSFEELNTFGVFLALQRYYDTPTPGDFRSENSVGQPVFQWPSGGSKYYTSAVSGNPAKAQNLLKLFLGFAPTYRRQRIELESSLAALKSNLEAFKQIVIPIKSDIEDGDFVYGTCDFERRINS